MKKTLRITSQEFGRGSISTTRFASLMEAAAYVAGQWQGDDYRDGPASFHTDYCTFLCHGFTLAEVCPVAPKCTRVDDSRRCTDDSCDAGALCDSCQIDRDEDGPGVNGPEAIYEGGFNNGIHWSDPRADYNY